VHVLLQGAAQSADSTPAGGSRTMQHRNTRTLRARNRMAEDKGSLEALEALSRQGYPASEADYWSAAYRDEPYYERGMGLQDYAPAYEIGWHGYHAYGGDVDRADRVLANDWQLRRGVSALTWQEARPAARAAWWRAHNARSFATSGRADEATIAATLNQLLRQARAGEEVYREAAENARTRTLATLFSRCHDACERAAGELSDALAQRGMAQEESPSLTEAARRVWVRFRSFFGGASDEKMLQECEEGEDETLGHLRDALAQDLPAQLHFMLLRQFERAQRDHDMLRSERARMAALAADAVAA
jgi:uncharacterized protein (TIGR02284 family)